MISHHDYLSKKPIHQTVLPRPVTSLGHQVERRVFWDGPNFSNYVQQQKFSTMPNIFSRGGESLPSPLVTGLCPIVLKYVQHICPGRTKIFLASYGPVFAPQCGDRLKMNVHLLLLWLATLQISATVRGCLRKTQLASVSIRLNSQLRVWVTGSGPMREGSSRCIVPGPDSCGGAWDRRTGP